MEIALYSLRSINRFFRDLHASGIWRTGVQQLESQRLVRTFCEGFAQLASMEASQGKLMFKLRPKLHMLLEAPSQNSSQEWALNCLAASCWSDEDFIGRVARTSRSCYGMGLAQSLRVLQKCLGAYKCQFRRATTYR